MLLLYSKYFKTFFAYERACVSICVYGCEYVYASVCEDGYGMCVWVNCPQYTSVYKQPRYDVSSNEACKIEDF